MRMVEVLIMILCASETNALLCDICVYGLSVMTGSSFRFPVFDKHMRSNRPSLVFSVKLFLFHKLK